MAEALAFASGVVSLAGFALQLTEAIQKLKGFCCRTIHAKEELDRLIHEIDVFEHILNDINDDPPVQNATSSASLQACVELCRAGVSQITKVANKFEKRLKTRKFPTSLQYALSKDDISELRQELERAKNTLSIAYNVYREAKAQGREVSTDEYFRNIIEGQVALNQMMQQIIIQPAAIHCARTLEVQSAQATPNFSASYTSLVNESTDSASRRERSGQYLTKSTLITLITPRIRGWRIWQLALQLEMTTWTASLHVDTRWFRVHDENSPAVLACMTGDLAQLQRLFSSKQASPYDLVTLSVFSLHKGLLKFARYIIYSLPESDQNPIGCLCAVAVAARQPRVVEFLLSLLAPSDLSICRLEDSSINLKPRGRNTHDLDYNWSGVVLPETMKMLELVARSLIREDSDQEHLIHFAYRSTAEREEDWFWACSKTLLVAGQEDWESYSSLLASYASRAAEWCQKLTETDTSRGCDIVRLYAAAWNREQPNLQLLRKLTAIAMQRVFPKFTAATDSLLVTFLQGTDQNSNDFVFLHARRAYYDKALKHWAGFMADTGTDLEEYGAWETTFFSKWMGSCTWKQDICPLRYHPLAYSADPEQWHFWWQHPGDAFAGDFWDMLEHPERGMPGAWYDSADRDAFYNEEYGENWW